jgi:hypothetical protein
MKTLIPRTCDAIQMTDTFALIMCPFFHEDRGRCGKVAVNFHECADRRVNLCVKHWDEYQRWLNDKRRR